MTSILIATAMTSLISVNNDIIRLSFGIFVQRIEANARLNLAFASIEEIPTLNVSIGFSESYLITFIKCISRNLYLVFSGLFVHLFSLEVILFLSFITDTTIKSCFPFLKLTATFSDLLKIVIV